MTSGGNNFNDFPEINWPSFNLEARTLRSCICLLHHFDTIVHGRKLGHLASREDLGRDAGQWGQDTGRPGKYGTVGNPRCNVHSCDADIIRDVFTHFATLASCLTSHLRSTIKWSHMWLWALGSEVILAVRQHLDCDLVINPSLGCQPAITFCQARMSHLPMQAYCIIVDNSDSINRSVRAYIVQPS